MDPVELAPTADPGEPLADHIRRRLERLLGRSLDDVRVHDHEQAERLTRQLGAEAFTVGRHVYVRRGGGIGHTSRNLGLLAHEATHVAQQTGAAETAVSAARPLAALPVVQRTSGATAEGAEQEALNAEVAAQQATTAARSVLAIDPEEVAERVYRLMMRDLHLDHERRSRP
jgi:hypothetical protein